MNPYRIPVFFPIAALAAALFGVAAASYSGEVDLQLVVVSLATGLLIAGVVEATTFIADLPTLLLSDDNEE